MYQPTYSITNKILGSISRIVEAHGDRGPLRQEGAARRDAARGAVRRRRADRSAARRARRGRPGRANRCKSRSHAMHQPVDPNLLADELIGAALRWLETRFSDAAHVQPYAHAA